MSELQPTMEHLNDPYVLQLIETLSRLDDEIEELNRIIIDERTAKIAWRSISANQEIEIERLRKVVESLRKGNEETKI